MEKIALTRMNVPQGARYKMWTMDFVKLPAILMPVGGMETIALVTNVMKNVTLCGLMTENVT
jgi:hypothetical protein